MALQLSSPEMTEALIKIIKSLSCFEWQVLRNCRNVSRQWRDIVYLHGNCRLFSSVESFDCHLSKIDKESVTSLSITEREVFGCFPASLNVIINGKEQVAFTNQECTSREITNSLLRKFNGSSSLSHLYLNTFHQKDSGDLSSILKNFFLCKRLSLFLFCPENDSFFPEVSSLPLINTFVYKSEFPYRRYYEQNRDQDFQEGYFWQRYDRFEEIFGIHIPVHELILLL